MSQIHISLVTFIGLGYEGEVISDKKNLNIRNVIDIYLWNDLGLSEKLVLVLVDS